MAKRKTKGSKDVPPDEDSAAATSEPADPTRTRLLHLLEAARNVRKCLPLSRVKGALNEGERQRLMLAKSNMATLAGMLDAPWTRADGMSGDVFLAVANLRTLCQKWGVTFTPLGRGEGVAVVAYRIKPVPLSAEDSTLLGKAVELLEGETRTDAAATIGVRVPTREQAERVVRELAAFLPKVADVEDARGAGPDTPSLSWAFLALMEAARRLSEALWDAWIVWPEWPTPAPLPEKPAGLPSLLEGWRDMVSMNHGLTGLADCLTRFFALLGIVPKGGKLRGEPLAWEVVPERTDVLSVRWVPSGKDGRKQVVDGTVTEGYPPPVPAKLVGAFELALRKLSAGVQAQVEVAGALPRCIVEQADHKAVPDLLGELKTALEGMKRFMLKHWFSDRGCYAPDECDANGAPLWLEEVGVHYARIETAFTRLRANGFDIPTDWFLWRPLNEHYMRRDEADENDHDTINETWRLWLNELGQIVRAVENEGLNAAARAKRARGTARAPVADADGERGIQADAAGLPDGLPDMLRRLWDALPADGSQVKTNTLAGKLDREPSRLCSDHRGGRWAEWIRENIGRDGKGYWWRKGRRGANSGRQ